MHRNFRKPALTTAPGATGIVKLRNAVRRFFGPDAELVNAKNIRVNGQLRGVSGFLKYKDGRFVYFNTERSVYNPMSDKFLFRAARDEKDYSGGCNCLCNATLEDLLSAIYDLLCMQAGPESGWQKNVWVW